MCRNRCGCTSSPAWWPHRALGLAGEADRVLGAALLAREQPALVLAPQQVAAVAPEVEVEQPQQRWRRRGREGLPVLRLALGEDQPRRPASPPPPARRADQVPVGAQALQV